MASTLTQSILVSRNFSLSKLNSLKLESFAEEYIRISSIEQLAEVSRFSGPLNLLGGGTNLLLFPKIEGRLLHIEIRGIEVKPDSNGRYSVRVGAGENWHNLVLHTLKLGIGGLENLALIPGNAGGAPYQNIGAYGRELSELIHSVEVFDLTSNSVRVLSNKECLFSYRNSVFRSKDLPRGIITHLNLVLGNLPFTTTYKDVREKLSGYATDEISHRLIAESVINIRQQKLPDIGKYPNVGSFFKNPTLTIPEFDRLRGNLDIEGHLQGETVRVPAARLIDAQKWKGKQLGSVLIWQRQPLVLVNCGGATAMNFLDVANRISDDVQRHYGLQLEVEPAIMGNEN